MKKFFNASLIILAMFIAVSATVAQNFTKEFYSGRRAELIKKMEGGVFILSAAKAQQRQAITDAPFQQNKNFLYLTGYNSPDAILLIAPKSANKYILFTPKARFFNRTTRKVEEKDIVKETIASYGVDSAYNLEDFEKVFKRYSAEESKIYCSRTDKETFDIVSKYTKDAAGNSTKKILDPGQLVAELRVIKTDEEISFLQKAVDITTEAHIEAMKASQPKMNERTLDAIIEYIYRLRWSSGFGFGSIVASGPRSSILHYMDNNQEMKDGDVCVMDLGAAYNGYSADITRTIPVNGTFTKEQREIYQAVLNANKVGIEQCIPGNKSQVVEEKVANQLRDELFKLGLITDKNTTWQHRIWYTHGCSHSIGLDVHDITPTSYYNGGMKPGMIFTMEPGLYISLEALEQAKQYRMAGEKEFNEFYEKVLPVAKKYANIGVRIEDDVLVTKDGNIVISAKCPKEIADIEKIMKQKSRFVD